MPYIMSPLLLAGLIILFYLSLMAYRTSYEKYPGTHTVRTTMSYAKNEHIPCICIIRKLFPY
jgi:hypothetical protein